MKTDTVTKHRMLVAECHVMASATPWSGPAEPLAAVTPFSVIGDLATQVGGERIDLAVLVGPDADLQRPDRRNAGAIATAPTAD